MKKKLLLLLLMVSLTTFSQITVVKARVIDKDVGLPLAGVKVVVENSKNKTVTNEKGFFSIKSKKNDILHFSLNNYQSLQKTVIDIKNVVALKIQKNIIRNVNVDAKIDSQNSIDSSVNTGEEEDDHNLAKIANKASFEKNLGAGIITFDDRDVDVEGTPYLDEKFVLAQLFLSKNNTKLLLKLRYNIPSDQFEAKVDNDVYGINKNDVDLIAYSGHFFKPFYNQSYELVYYEVIGRYKNKLLLKRYFSKESENVYIEGMSVGNHSVTISKYAKYFIKEDDSDVLKPYKMKKKFMNKIFGDDKLIAKYVKDHKLKMKKDEDYIKVFNYYYNLPK